MVNPLAKLNDMGLWSYSVSRSVSVPLVLNLLIILAIPVYLTIIVIIVLAGGEYQSVTTTAYPGNFNQTIKLWYQTFLPNKVKTKSAWQCNPNVLKPGDRILPSPQLLTIELLSTVTQMNTYTVNAFDNGNGLPNAQNYSNNPLTGCFINQINFIPPANDAESTQVTVLFDCCIVLKLGLRRLFN
jgi:hypothetical protein